MVAMNKFLTFFLILLVSLTASQYAYWTFTDTVSNAEEIVTGTQQKPFVYRALIPWAAHTLTELGLSAPTALTIMVILSAIALMYGILSLFKVSQQETGPRELILSAVGVQVFMLVFFMECKVYDLATAAFFAFSISSLTQKKYQHYFLLFPFACFNRETAILLIGAFAVSEVSRMKSWKFLDGLAYQVIIFVLSRLFLMDLYSVNSGDEFLYRPMENIETFLEQPMASILHWLVLAFVAYTCFVQWKTFPGYTAVSFIVLLPTLLTMYIFFGVSFEVRVFAEAYPLAWITVVTYIRRISNDHFLFFPGWQRQAR